MRNFIRPELAIGMIFYLIFNLIGCGGGSGSGGGDNGEAETPTEERLQDYLTDVNAAIHHFPPYSR